MPITVSQSPSLPVWESHFVWQANKSCKYIVSFLQEQKIASTYIQKTGMDEVRVAFLAVKSYMNQEQIIKYKSTFQHERVLSLNGYNLISVQTVY